MRLGQSTNQSECFYYYYKKKYICQKVVSELMFHLVRFCLFSDEYIGRVGEKQVEEVYIR